MDIRSFKEFIGHKEIIKNLQNSIANDKVSHAYIFAGEKGSGRKLMASVFAAALECENNSALSPENKEPEPCQHCPSCIKAFRYSHPDIIMVTHEKPNVITVDEIREQVVESSVIKPYEGKYKIYIIEDADKMNVQAQNALLKTIEEPPEYIVIILIASNKEAMLPTISSRCVTLSFGEIREEDIKNYLVGELQISRDEAGVITAFSRGNIGKAKSVALSDDFGEKIRISVEFISRIDEMTLEECVAESARIAKDKANIAEQLDIYDMWFRDVLMYKATMDSNELIFRQYREEVRSAGKNRGYENLTNIFDAIENARKRIKANVSTELTLQLLFITIKEN
ncbi:MAG: DNA polymerase III subunit delta' [Lachnospiraceae bacterium]|jgi:DNA polymerase-3 subunit delta'